MSCHYHKIKRSYCVLVYPFVIMYHYLQTQQSSWHVKTIFVVVGHYPRSFIIKNQTIFKQYEPPSTSISQDLWYLVSTIIDHGALLFMEMALWAGHRASSGLIVGQAAAHTIGQNCNTRSICQDEVRRHMRDLSLWDVIMVLLLSYFIIIP